MQQQPIWRDNKQQAASQACGPGHQLKDCERTAAAGLRQSAVRPARFLPADMSCRNAHAVRMWVLNVFSQGQKSCTGRTCRIQVNVHDRELYTPGAAG